MEPNIEFKRNKRRDNIPQTVKTNNQISRNSLQRPINKRKNKKKKLNKRKIMILMIILILLIAIIIKLTKSSKKTETSAKEEDKTIEENTSDNNQVSPNPVEEKPKKEITDWRLKLANYENILPEDFTVEVENIDELRQFDARAIKYLNQMMDDMRKDGITNVWIQSAYRSVARQKELYDKSVKKYIQQGETREEAERLTMEYINKPGSSDHNLGLAVDFNDVNNDFEKLKGFKWLQENAENYGFILRYPKGKEDITQIAYESWHWRYVGEEHAKKMNELKMCLEEYVEYLRNQ